MEHRHLLYFKTVAEELHFRRAAEKLFISQPPLSRQIKELEAELGVNLFERNNKRVLLTPAGAYLKKEVDLLFTRLETLKYHLKEIEGSVSGQLRIGYISSINQHHLFGLLKEVKQVFPLVKTRLYELPTIKQVKALEEDKLDIGVMRAPVKSGRLQIKSLFREAFVLVMPKGTPEYNSLEELSVDIAQHSFIFFNKNYAPEYFGKLEEICQRLGFCPDVSHEANNVHSILKLVEKGLGVSIVPASLKSNFQEMDLRFYDLDSLPISTEVVLAYKKTNEHPACRWFVERYNG